MPETYDLIIRGGTVVNHDGIGRTDVGVRDGRTAFIGDLGQADAGEVIDATGLHVLPGVIDSQVHFREPGAEHKENLEAGMAGAALGGVTAIFEMPNTKPSTTTPEAIQDKLDRAKGRAAVDHAFYVGAAAENTPELADLELLPGVAGVKIFMGASTGNLLVPDDPSVLAVLKSGRRRVAVHCEDEPRMNEREGLRVTGDPSSHPVWRDAESAIRATTRLLALARQAGRRIHVLHVTTAEEMVLLAAHKDIATVEATPQHLTLAGEEAYPALGTLAQMNPPIRDAAHRAGLWRGLAQGVVDVIGSDHAPHTREEKAKPYPASPSGMPGVQTLVPIMLDHVNAGRLSLTRFMDLTSAGPSRVFGMAGKGRLAQGYDADYTLVDLKRTETITHAQMANISGWTPFDGKSVTGWPVMTLVRGHIVMRDGALTGPKIGQPVRFQECL
ncbi:MULTISPECIES: dihydroorotase [unclassified Minwuia]|jgi:dihydroorotase|uniref:dihydroorotase n=1 Tax=unclassified Minwuia TaxID=2618799 RepID=UPI00247B040F|nr:MULTISPECIES: dihydroorotase [unclassified Minwuia]